MNCKDITVSKNHQIIYQELFALHSLKTGGGTEEPDPGQNVCN